MNHMRDLFETYSDKLIAEFKGDGDGLNTKVYETALPAKFYHVKVEAGRDSMGMPKQCWTLGTGSGSEMRELALTIARAVSEGMLSLTAAMKIDEPEA